MHVCNMMLRIMVIFPLLTDYLGHGCFLGIIVDATEQRFLLTLSNHPVLCAVVRRKCRLNLSHSTRFQ